MNRDSLLGTVATWFVLQPGLVDLISLLVIRTIDYIIRKLKADLTTSMGLALAFWGPTQTLMFLYVPEDYHTEIISTLGIIYSAMYSHVVHREVFACFKLGCVQQQQPKKCLHMLFQISQG